MSIARGPLSALATVGSGTTLAVTWTGTQPATGSTVLVFVQINTVTTSNLSAADNGVTPSTFTMDVNTTSGHGAVIFRADGITLPASGNYKVTLTSTQGPGTMSSGGIAYTGVKAGGPSVTGTGGATSTGPVQASSSVSSAGPGAIYFTAFSDNSGVNPETITLNSTPTFTQRFVNANGASFWPCACADAITSGSQQPNWTLGDSIAWGTVIGVYEAAGTDADAGLAAGTGAALSPVSASAPAGLASGTGTGQNTAFQLAPAGLAAGTGTAQQPVVGQSNAPAGLASGTGTAQAALMAQAGLASGTGAAQAAVAQIPGNPLAGLASGTGTALATAFQTAPAGLAAGSGTARQAGTSTPSGTSPPGLAFSQALYSVTGGTLQTRSFTPATGSIIVVKVLTEDSSSYPVTGTPSGGGWTYTRQARDSTSLSCWAGIWTAPVTSSGAPQTVFLAGPAGGSTHWMMTVEVWSGAQVAGSPAIFDARGTGFPSATVTTTSDNSVVSWVNGDWFGKSGTPAYQSAAIQDALVQDSQYSGYSAYQPAAVPGSQVIGMTNPASQAYVLLGIEIQPVPPPGASAIAVLASGTGRAQGNDVSASSSAAIGATGLASGTGTAPRPAASTPGQVNTPAGLASAAGRAQGDDVSPSFGASVSAGKLATGTASAQGNDVSATFLMQVTTFAGTGAGTGTAQQPATAAPGSAPAGLASGTGTAQQPSLTVGSITAPAAGLAAGGGTAQQPLAVPAASLILPVVATTAATSVTGTSAFLNGTVNPQGLSATWQFQYGLTTAYGTVVPAIPGVSGAGTSAVSESYALSGLAPSTTYHYQLTAINSAGTAAGGDQSFTTTSLTGGVAFPGKPPNPLGFKVELLLNNTWTDITKYVMQRDGAHITNMGRTDEASGIQASQMAITLKNTDGRFTPKNAAGAYYPYILRNTQIRVSVNATSPPPANVPYNGYRYWGEVSSWPPTSDISQHDVYVQLVASGIWRQISQSQVTIGSAYARYVGQLTGVNVPASYWPMEDGTGSTVFVIGIGAGTDATFTAPPSFAQDGTSFTGSDALPQFNSARITANVSSAATPTDNVTRFALAVPAGGDGAAGQSRWCITETDSSGTVALLETFINPDGTLTMDGVTALGATPLFSVTTTTNVQGKPVLVSAELTPGGSGVTYALNIIAPGGTTVLETKTGSISGSVGAVTAVKMNRSGVLSNTTAGQLGVFYSVPSLLTAAAALSGWEGEYAVVRFQRLCAEFGIASEVIGSTSPQMGPQVDDTLVNILQIIENTDGGLLYETRDQFGMGYRTLISLQNQSPAVVLNYTAGMLGAQLAATYDDQFVKNQWQIANWDGYTALATLLTGPVSILPVPNGVGLYSGQATVNALTHAQVNAIAQQRLFQGSVDDIRYPQVTVDLRRAAVAASLFATVPALRIGDYLQITNLPAFEGASTAKQVVLGWEETLNAFTWTPVYNTAPELPFETSFSPGIYEVIQAPSGSVAQGSSIGASVAGSQIGSGAVGGITSTSTLTARSIGGVTSFVAAPTPYDWSFAVSGSPADMTYFTCTGPQAVPISAGDTFTNSVGYGGPFTVTQLAPPSGGNVNVYFTPSATAIMSTGTVFGGKNGDTWVNTAAGNQLAQWQNGAWLPIQFGPTALSFSASGGAKVTISATAPVNPAVGDIWIDSSNGYVVKQFTG